MKQQIKQKIERQLLSSSKSGEINSSSEDVSSREPENRVASQSLDYADIHILNEQNKKLEAVINLTRENRRKQELHIKELIVSHDKEINQLNKKLRGYQKMVHDLKKSDNYETVLEYQEQLTTQRQKSKSQARYIKKQRALLRSQQKTIVSQKLYIKRLRQLQKHSYRELVARFADLNEVCRQQQQEKKHLEGTVRNYQRQIQTYKQVFNRQLLDVQATKQQLRGYVAEKTKLQAENRGLQEELSRIQLQLAEIQSKLQLMKKSRAKCSRLTQTQAATSTVPEQHTLPEDEAGGAVQNNGVWVASRLRLSDSARVANDASLPHIDDLINQQLNGAYRDSRILQNTCQGEQAARVLDNTCLDQSQMLNECKRAIDDAEKVLSQDDAVTIGGPNEG